jgi:hypothetical protein
MFDQPIPYVEFVAESSYTVTFYVLKPKRARTTESVKAKSTGDARSIIIARYGKENIQIVSVRKEQ